ncbi:uncharacterized protein [Henckelia pumila]|uniref:uncharacterized protein n=1 Tax=Henckelia pumila TaxID=405737 RepID=UPI003C6DF71B
MCGIALILSGIQIDSSPVSADCTSPSPPSSFQPLFSEDDIKIALQRRGPDSLGTKDVYLGSKCFSEGRENCVVESLVEDEGLVENGVGRGFLGELRFIGATLQLRGVNPVVQPLTDASGNVLVYNGEIFGGIYMSCDSNDTEVLMQSLGKCCSCISHVDSRSSCCSGTSQDSIPKLLSRIKGPWSLIYWQDTSKTLWFGRDAFGRRSLLVHWPTAHDSRLMLSSVSPTSLRLNYEFDEKQTVELNFWEELPCGIYSISVSALDLDGHLLGKVRKHEWNNSELNELITWERSRIHPKPEELSVSWRNVPIIQHDILSAFPLELEPMKASVASHRVLIALRESVMRRTTSNRIYMGRHVPVAVLFSGGLDSMIIAALVHHCIDKKYEIDLLNVSFDGESAPDRISARAGLKELQKNAPFRRWNLVEIDADLQNLPSEMKHVESLINPAKTYMDLNIGVALWIASRGDGWLYEDVGEVQGRHVRYKSDARILLVGAGADEQCAGYGRHRTKYRNGSWLGLHQEMKLDMQRIWKRNLGRDDRCIADNAKEARFPFLDEDVIKTLLDIPLWEIADLDQPSGVGDKKILREVARFLGLNEAAALPKRAIQFGSRIARESNKKNFGSNRAANQASAGSVAIY